MGGTVIALPVFLLFFMALPFDTGDMPPLYFVPDNDSRLLSDHCRDGSVFFGAGRGLPEDIHWRCLCHRGCRFLAEGRTWREVCGVLDVDEEGEMTACFVRYMGMTPDAYGQWCRQRS